MPEFVWRDVVVDFFDGKLTSYKGLFGKFQVRIFPTLIE